LSARQSGGLQFHFRSKKFEIIYFTNPRKSTVIGEAYRLEADQENKTAKTHARKGVWKCAACREQFTVTVETIMADSHIPLHKWLYAFHLLCASKKGMSAHQFHRMLGITDKSAWFMAPIASGTRSPRSHCHRRSMESWKSTKPITKPISEVGVAPGTYPPTQIPEKKRKAILQEIRIVGSPPLLARPRSYRLYSAAARSAPFTWIA
jgi:hypothetical protein